MLLTTTPRKVGMCVLATLLIGIVDVGSEALGGEVDGLLGTAVSTAGEWDSERQLVGSGATVDVKSATAVIRTFKASNQRNIAY
jgi:hypothetical protein